MSKIPFFTPSEIENVIDQGIVIITLNPMT